MGRVELCDLQLKVHYILARCTQGPCPLFKYYILLLLFTLLRKYRTEISTVGIFNNFSQAQFALQSQVGNIGEEVAHARQHRLPERFSSG